LAIIISSDGEEILMDLQGNAKITQIAQRGAESRVNRLEQAFGERDGLSLGQRAIVQWLEIWRLTPQKRAYLQRVGREDLMERAEPLQGMLEDSNAQRAFLARLEAPRIMTLEGFLSHLRPRAHERAEEE
jgi:hypothetical protein